MRIGVFDRYFFVRYPVMPLIQYVIRIPSRSNVFAFKAGVAGNMQDTLAEKGGGLFLLLNEHTIIFADSKAIAWHVIMFFIVNYN